ncbi:hypothetical protein DITRI_Ditri02bG0021200 [Diplodiscus trichospermus]
MVDAIQRLGIDHHFQYEIEKVLKKQYMLPPTKVRHDYDLYEVALRFRLLRQEGYFVPAGVFNRFKDTKGSFRHELDPEKWGTAEVAHFLGKAVRNTLDQPFHKSLSRFAARNLLNNFHGTNGWINILQELAKLDFNIVQSLHQTEIVPISKYVRFAFGGGDLGLSKELEFARDQPLKWYIWSMACLTDPTFVRGKD